MCWLVCGWSCLWWFDSGCLLWIVWMFVCCVIGKMMCSCFLLCYGGWFYVVGSFWIVGWVCCFIVGCVCVCDCGWCWDCSLLVGGVCSMWLIWLIFGERNGWYFGWYECSVEDFELFEKEMVEYFNDLILKWMRVWWKCLILKLCRYLCWLLILRVLCGLWKCWIWCSLWWVWRLSGWKMGLVVVCWNVCCGRFVCWLMVLCFWSWCVNWWLFIME